MVTLFYLILPPVLEKSMTTMAIICTQHGMSAPTLMAHFLAGHKSLKTTGLHSKKNSSKNTPPP
eukprot:15333549-Ditylum_brightwellii.AAC.1